MFQNYGTFYLSLLKNAVLYLNSVEVNVEKGVRRENAIFIAGLTS